MTEPTNSYGRVRKTLTIKWSGDEYRLRILDHDHNPPDLLFFGLELVRIGYGLLRKATNAHNDPEPEPADDAVWN